MTDVKKKKSAAKLISLIRYARVLNISHYIRLSARKIRQRFTHILVRYPRLFTISLLIISLIFSVTVIKILSLNDIHIIPNTGDGSQYGLNINLFEQLNKLISDRSHKRDHPPNIPNSVFQPLILSESTVPDFLQPPPPTLDKPNALPQAIPGTLPPIFGPTVHPALSPPPPP